MSKGDVNRSLERGLLGASPVPAPHPGPSRSWVQAGSRADFLPLFSRVQDTVQKSFPASSTTQTIYKADLPLLSDWLQDTPMGLRIHCPAALLPQGAASLSVSSITFHGPLKRGLCEPSRPNPEAPHIRVTLSTGQTGRAWLLLPGSSLEALMPQGRSEMRPGVSYQEADAHQNLKTSGQVSPHFCSPGKM